MDGDVTQYALEAARLVALGALVWVVARHRAILGAFHLLLASGAGLLLLLVLEDVLLRAGSRMDAAELLAVDVARAALYVVIAIAAWEVTRALGRNALRTRALEGTVTAIITGANDAIITLDRDGRIGLWNRAAEQLTGVPPSSAIGRAITEFVPATRLHEVERATQVFRGERIAPFDTTVLTSTGDEVPISLSVSPIRAIVGDIIGLAIIARDATERHELEAKRALLDHELRDADNAKRYVIAVASHELRTPITSISGFASTLLHRWEQLAEEDRRSFVQIIDEQSERLRRLVEDLLAMSRIESGSVQAHPSRVPLLELLSDASESLELDQQTELDVPASLAVWVDDLHLRQVVCNLLSNASLHGKPPITISASQRGSRVELRIRDAGPGVDATLVPQLFERFSRGPDTNITGSTGLGLAICRGLLEANGGSIRYEPIEPRGGVFVVELSSSINPAYS